MFRRFFDWLVKSLFPQYKYIYRDSVSGRIVTREYAKKYPDTTYRDRVER